MKTTAVKTISGCVPSDDEEWAKIPMGAVFGVDYTKTRNYENHKRFFSFITCTFDMQEHFENKDVYRKWLTMKAGYFETVVTPKGETIFLPDSISFEKMDEVEFKELFNKCINVFLREVGGGCTKAELMHVIGFD